MSEKRAKTMLGILCFSFLSLTGFHIHKGHQHVDEIASFNRIMDGKDKDIRENKEEIAGLEREIKRKNNQLWRSKNAFKKTLDSLSYILDTLEENQGVLVETIVRLKKDREILNAQINGAGGLHSRGHIEELKAQRDHIDSLLQIQLAENRGLDAEIMRLQDIERQANVLASEMVPALYELHNVLFQIIRTSDDLYYETQTEPGTGDFHLPSEVEKKLEVVWNHVWDLRDELEMFEQKNSQFEQQQDTIFGLQKMHDTFHETIANLRTELKIREARIKEIQRLVDIRHLLIASTDSLIQWGIIKEEKKKRLFKKRKIEFDRNMIERSLCQTISKTDREISIPYSKKRIKIHTAHQDFNLEPLNFDPGSSKIVVWDKEQFWKAEQFVVVEIMD